MAALRLLYDCSRHNGPITLSLIASILYYTEIHNEKSNKIKQKNIFFIKYKKAHLKWNICPDDSLLEFHCATRDRFAFICITFL